MRKAARPPPDLVVADIRMPPTHTDDGLRAALRCAPTLPGPAGPRPLPARRSADYAAELLESGDRGVGYLLKQRIADVDAFVADAAPRRRAAARCSTPRSSPR